MISYRDSIDDVTPDRLTGLFVGWSNPPSPETHLTILERSDHVLLAVDDAIGQVVGFITAISDGVLCAYIPLLEVLPEYQGKGIGSELVRRMIAKLDSLYMIDILCDVGVQPFYERVGMVKANGVMLRRYDRQSGGRDRAEVT